MRSIEQQSDEINFDIAIEAGAEPDIFIWGGHWWGQFCNKGSCQWSVQDFQKETYRKKPNFGGATGGPGKIWGGQWPPLAPP